MISLLQPCTEAIWHQVKYSHSWLVQVKHVPKPTQLIRNLFRCMCTGFPLRSSCVVSSVSSCLLSFSSAVLFLHQQGAHSFLLAAGPQRSFKQWWPLTTNAHPDHGLPPPFLLILKRWQLILFALISLCIHFEGSHQTARRVIVKSARR